MALISVCSASGSSGVTTTVVGLMMTWPRPVVVVEADPSGGSQILAGYFRGLARPGLSELVLAHRQQQLSAELGPRLFEVADSRARFLPGTRSPLQASTVVGIWDALLGALRQMESTDGVDVIVDAGRLGLVGSPEPLIAESDVTLLVAGSGLPELAAVRSWQPWLGRGSSAVRIALVDPGHPYEPGEVERDLGVPVLGTIPWVTEAARVWSHGEKVRSGRRSAALVRAVSRLGESLLACAEISPAAAVRGLR